MTLPASLPDDDTNLNFSTSYALLYACFLSGQVTSKQWAEHLQDEHFAAWVEKQENKR